MYALPRESSSDGGRNRVEERRRSEGSGSHHEELQKIYTDLDIPIDISPVTFGTTQKEGTDKIENTTSAVLKGNRNTAGFFSAFESTSPTAEGANIEITDVRSLGEDEGQASAPPTHDGDRRQTRPKKEPTVEDKNYRADREYVKRRSHQKMIWFFRHLNIRHPAAIRTHLERVKHTEFELPNLQCVYPHQELSIACDDEVGTARGGDGNPSRPGKNAESAVAANMNYYNIYCATPALVDRVRRMMGASTCGDPDYNKKLITFIADIVGRLLWHSNRIHTVMFAKSDHLDRDCFLLYSRQVEPTPFSMRSDSFYCRRHDSDKYKSIAPQPDLTRANSSRVANESCIYIVGCDISEIWSSFPYEYRSTNCRPMKPLYDRLKQIDPAILEKIFSPLGVHVNGYREDSPYVEVASTTSFDVLSALLRDPDTKDITADDSTAYREWLERFVLTTVLNVHAKLRLNIEWKMDGRADTRQPSLKPLNRVILHNVNYRRETRTLRTNRVYYYRNANDFICSHSLLDDRFEDHRALDETEVLHRRPIYFYDVMQLFEYDLGDGDGNYTAVYVWGDATTMIQESAHTIGQYLTPEVIRNPPPEDPFYPPSTMSSIDLAIDRMLERAIKHAKKIKLPSSPTCDRRQPKRRMVEGINSKEYVPIEEDQGYARNTIARSLTKFGENRLCDGYTSPTRQNIETVITHNGQEVPVQIKVGSGGKPMTRVEYRGAPSVQVCDRLVCAYLVDPTHPEQIRVVPGSYITDREKENYVQLKINDRIVRVFCVQHMAGNTCLIKPFVYIIFRNMPYTVINNDLITEMFQDMLAYDGYQGFEVFDNSESSGIVPDSHYAECQQLEQPRRETALNGDTERDPLLDLVAEEQRNTRPGEEAIESLLSTVDWGQIGV